MTRPARDVYDPKQQSYRVDFACSVILSGREITRKFDTCFEMGDGDEVCARIYRRALKNPRLMAALPKYLRVESCREQCAKHFPDMVRKGQLS